MYKVPSNPDSPEYHIQVRVVNTSASTRRQRSILDFGDVDVASGLQIEKYGVRCSNTVRIAQNMLINNVEVRRTTTIANDSTPPCGRFGVNGKVH